MAWPISVPDTDTFNFINVANAVDDSTNITSDTLLKAFAEASTGNRDGYWDQRYMEAKDEMDDFRNWTKPISPVVSTDDPSALIWPAFMMKGTMIDHGQFDTTSTGFVYSTSDTDPIVGGQNCFTIVVSNSAIQNSTPFDYILYNEPGGSTYYHKAYSSNNNGGSNKVYGLVKSFVLPIDTLPTVTTVTYTRSAAVLGVHDTSLYGDLETLGSGGTTRSGFITKAFTGAIEDFEYGEAGVSDYPYQTSGTFVTGDYAVVGPDLRTNGHTNFLYRAYAKGTSGTYRYGTPYLADGTVPPP